MTYSAEALASAKHLRANYREALMRKDENPKGPLDEALDWFAITTMEGRVMFREVIHILSEKNQEVNL